jgi:hypothetical protein
MLSLKLRKTVVLVLVATVFLLGNLIVITGWLQQAGVIGWAQDFREEFLTGTAITILVALLILIVGPGKSRDAGGSNCPVCDRSQRGGRYCKHCGSARA